MTVHWWCGGTLRFMCTQDVLSILTGVLSPPVIQPKSSSSNPPWRTSSLELKSVSVYHPSEQLWWTYLDLLLLFKSWFFKDVTNGLCWPRRYFARASLSSTLHKKLARLKPNAPLIWKNYISWIPTKYNLAKKTWQKTNRINTKEKCLQRKDTIPWSCQILAFTKCSNSRNVPLKSSEDIQKLHQPQTPTTFWASQHWRPWTRDNPWQLKTWIW